MFLLSEAEILNGISLKTISRIDIYFYNTRNDIFNIVNLEFDFDENLIPLITSILESKPFLISRKTYYGFDKDFIIEKAISCSNTWNYNLGNMFSNNESLFPSFIGDIEKFNKTLLGHKCYWQSNKVHYSYIYTKSQECIKIYSKENITHQKNNKNNQNLDKNLDKHLDKHLDMNIFNPQDVINSKEETVIYWRVPGIGENSRFECCISPLNKKCSLRLIIEVIEDNNFINSKVDGVNNWLEKIHKIKSTIKIA